MRGQGNERDESGRWFSPSYTSLHSSVTGPLARERFYVCPIYEGQPGAHPESAIGLRAYHEWRTFGLTDRLKSSRMMGMIEVVHEEMTALEAVRKARG